MPERTDKEFLQAVRDRLTPPGAWTQGVFRRDINGDELPGLWADPGLKPVCWCLLGAAAEIGGSKFYCLSGNEMAFGGMYASEVLNFNDEPGRTQAEVLAKLDEMIAAAA